MDQHWNIWVVGGDLRQAALARALAQDGHQVHTFALEQCPDLPSPASGPAGIENARCVILPLPAVREGLIPTPLSHRSLSPEEILPLLTPGTVVCAGMVSPALARRSEVLGLVPADYFAREELAVANAIPTGEGAIQLAMEALPITLHGARVLVVGYGRIGKVLSHQLLGLGAQVTVAARKPADLAWAKAGGCAVRLTGELDKGVDHFDLVVNTVPAPVVGRDVLAGLRRDCLVMDLASTPGGVDFDAAKELGLKTIWALSLPGKAAPVTAALAIRDAIYNILNELGA